LVRSRPLLWAALGFGTLVGGFLLWPSPIAPQPFVPAEALPPSGPLAPNDALRDPQRTELIGDGQINFPEDVTFDAQGRLYVGNRDRPNGAASGSDVDARIERITFADDGTYRIEPFVSLPGGGPLDMRFDADGNVIVSSWGQGLIAIDESGAVRTIVADGTLIDGRPYGYSDGIAIGSDSMIYHTQGTSDEWNSQPTILHFLSNAGPGRLIATDPVSGASRTLIDDLSFGNGVALSPDERYVLVADQLRYRILRYWLSGPQAGTQEVWIDTLPGMPHNLFLDDAQVLWVALNRPRVGLGDRIRASGFLASQAAKVWPLLQGQDVQAGERDPAARGAGSVLALDLNGQLLLSLQNPPMQMNTLSTAVYHEGALYIGTIGGGPLLRYTLDERPLP
jgi:hypothetical protein